MALTAAKLVEQSRQGVVSRDGYRFVRVYSVAGTPTVADAEAADEVLSASGLPSIGDAFSASRPTALCLSLSAARGGAGAQWLVTAEFGDATDESNDPRLDAQGIPRFFTSTTQVRTAQDRNGVEMAITYQDAMSNVLPGAIGTIDYADRIEAEVDLPLTGFEITRRSTSLSTLLAEQQAYPGRINSLAWDRTLASPAGVAVWPAQTVKCVGIDVDTVNESEYRVRYRFEHDPGTFLLTDYPRPYGVIPSNAVATSFEVLNQADFNALPCYV